MPTFELECQTLRKARNEMGPTNIKFMVPFCRTPDEVGKVIEIMERSGPVPDSVTKTR